MENAEGFDLIRLSDRHDRQFPMGFRERSRHASRLCQGSVWMISYHAGCRNGFGPTVGREFVDLLAVQGKVNSAVPTRGQIKGIGQFERSRGNGTVDQQLLFSENGSQETAENGPLMDRRSSVTHPISHTSRRFQIGDGVLIRQFCDFPAL